MSLREAWDDHAENWIRWARAPGHDSYRAFHGARFFELVPPPGRLTIDLGAGEGRVARDLRARGHTVIEADGSPRMASASAELGGRGVLADMARLPFASGIADLAVAFMSLQDVDDLAGAIREAARVLVEDGRLVMAIVHPINSAGAFGHVGDDSNRPFVIHDSYVTHRRIADDIERDGLRMRFESEHRPLETYCRALEDAGFLLEAVREITEPDPQDKWSRIPLFLDLRAIRSPGG